MVKIEKLDGVLVGWSVYFTCSSTESGRPFLSVLDFEKCELIWDPWMHRKVIDSGILGHFIIAHNKFVKYKNKRVFFLKIKLLESIKLCLSRTFRFLMSKIELFHSQFYNWNILTHENDQSFIFFASEFLVSKKKGECWEKVSTQ